MRTTAAIGIFAALLTVSGVSAWAAGSHGSHDMDHGDGHTMSGHDMPHASGAADGHGHDAMLGKAAVPARATRTVAITMDDNMRFTPNRIEVKRGETVRFVLTNAGRLKHEMVLGSRAELKEHAALMRKFPEMEHDDPNAVSVAPGGKGELAWTFEQAGTVDFACMAPGHLEAGMTGMIAVSN